MEEKFISSALKITEWIKHCRHLYRKLVAWMEIIPYYIRIQGLSRLLLSSRVATMAALWIGKERRKIDYSFQNSQCKKE